MKKFLSVFMVVAMLFSMTACGSKPAEAAPAAAPAASSEKAASNATAVEVFTLGVQGPLTGGAAIYGNAVLNGAQVAVDEINAAGGAIQFKLLSQDDEADSGDKAINAYNALIDGGMQALVGPTTSGSGITVAAKAYEERVFCLTPSGSSTDVIKDNDNMFQVCFTDPNQGVASADYIKENFAGKKVAVIYRNDDAYSQGIHDTFVAQAKANGIEVVYEGTFTDSTSSDFSVQLTAAQNASAEVVFLPIYYTPASVILTQANSMGYSPVFFGVDGMDGILSMEGFDAKLAEGVYLLTPFSADKGDKLTNNFVEKFKKAYNEIPNQFAADAYDAVYIIKAAMEKAGVKASQSAEEICEALVKVMPEIKVDGVTGEGMTWAATGEVAKAPMAIVIKDGTYVTP